MLDEAHPRDVEEVGYASRFLKYASLVAPTMCGEDCPSPRAAPGPVAASWLRRAGLAPGAVLLPRSVCVRPGPPRRRGSRSLAASLQTASARPSLHSCPGVSVSLAGPCKVHNQFVDVHATVSWGLNGIGGAGAVVSSLPQAS